MASACMVGRALPLALVLLLLSCAVARTNLRNNDNSPNFVLLPCSQESFYISFDYPEIVLSAFNSSDTETITMTVTNGVVGEGAIEEGCTATSVRECSVELTCELVDNDEWFIEVINQQGEPVEFNVTTISRTVVTEPLTLNQPETTTINLSKEDFGTDYDFWQLAIQPPSQFAFVNVTIYDIGPDDDDIESVIVSPRSIGSPDDVCVLFQMQDIQGSGELILSSCDLELINPNGGTLTWFVQVMPKTANKNVTYTLEVSVNDFDIIELEDGQATDVQFITQQHDVLYYSIDVPEVEEGEEQKQLNISVITIQGGEANVTYAGGFLPWEECRGQTEVVCDSATQCDIVVPWCDVDADTYYIAVAAQELTLASQPLTYRVNATFVDPPDTSDAQTLKNDAFVATTVKENEYVHFEFSTDGFKASADTWLNLQLYVDTTDFGPTTMFVNPGSLAGNPDSSCFENFRQCQVGSGSCVIQIYACDYADADTWYVSVLGGDAKNFFGGGTRFTVRATLLDPIELSDDSIVKFGNVFEEEYDEYIIHDNLLAEGEIVFVDIASVVGGSVRVYTNRDQLAGDPCETRACYGHDNDPQLIAPGESTSLQFARCSDDDDDIYIGVRGVNATNGAEYTVTLIRDNAPLEPLNRISEGKVVTGFLRSENLNLENYTMADSGSERRLVVTLSLLELDGNPSMTLTLHSGEFLNCLTPVATCTTTDTDGSSCQIVLQPCEFDRNDDYILAIEGTENVLYNLQYELIKDSTTTLDNGVAVADEVMYKEYHFYQFKTDGVNSTLVVEAYFDNDIGAEGSLFVSTSGSAGQPPCYSFRPPSCTDDEKCVFIVNACDMEKTTYFISIYTQAQVIRPFPGLKYTLKASEVNAVVPFDFGEVNAFEIYPGQRRYHTIQVPEIDDSDGEIINIYVGAVERGTVQAFVSFGSPLVHCPCFEHSHSMTVTANDPVGVLSLQYCELFETGEWTIEIIGADAAADVLIGYTLSMEQLSQTPTALEPLVVQEDNAANNRYKYYSLEGINKEDQATLELFDVRGGSVSVFFSSQNPATSACSWGSACEDTTSSCSIQLGSCLPTPKFISVLAIADNADPVFWNITVDIQPIEVLPLRIAQPKTIPPSFSELYSFNIPANTEGPLIDIRVEKLRNSNVLVTATEAPCDVGAAHTQTCTAGQDLCSLLIGDCDISSRNWTIRIDSLSTGGPDAQFNLYVDVVGTATNVFQFPDGGSDDNNLAPFQFRVYEIPNPRIDEVGPPQKQLTVSGSNILGSLAVFLQSSRDASDYPSVGCAELQDLACQACTLLVPPCCLQNSTYYVTIRNLANRTISYSLSYEIDVVATYNEISLSDTPIDFTTSSNVLTENRWNTTFDSFNGGNSSFPYMQVIVRDQNVNETAPKDVYVERISAAGSDGSCLTNMANCIGTADCDLQFIPCPGVPLIGSFYGAVSDPTPDDIDVSFEVTIRNPIPLNVTGDVVVSGTTASSLAWDFYEVVGLNPGNALQTLTLEVSRASVNNTPVSVAVVEGSLCSFGTTTNICTTQFGQLSCALTVSLCSLTQTVLVGVQSQVSADYNLTATQNTEAVMDLGSANVTLAQLNSTVNYFHVNLTGANVDASSLWSAVFESSGGIAEISMSYDNQFCFQAENLCDGRMDGANTCDVSIGACRLISNEDFFLRVTLGRLGNLTITLPGLKEENIVDMDLNGAPKDGEVKLLEAIRYKVDLTADTVASGQGVILNVPVVCGDVTVYVNDDQANANHDCDALPRTLVGDSAVLFDACEIMRHGLPDAVYVTVEGSTQDEPEYGIGVDYLISASTTGSPINFVTVQPGELVTRNATEDPLATNVYVYPIESTGDFAGETALQFSGPPNSRLTFYFDEPPMCDSADSVECTTDEPCSISSCDLSTHRNIYFQLQPLWPAESTTVRILPLTPFVRDWNEDGLDEVQSGVVSIAPPIERDAEHYMFTLDPEEIDFFRLTITLRVTSGSTATFLYSNSVPPGVGNGCNFETCTPVGGLCVKVIEGCDWIPGQTAYITVTNGDGAAANANYELSLTTQEPSQELEQATPICVSMLPGERRWFDADYGSFDDTEQFNLRLSSIEQPDIKVLLNAATRDDIAPPLASEQCHRFEETCNNDVGCDIYWPCLANGTISISVENLAGLPNTFFIFWDRVDNNIKTLNGTVTVDGSFAADYYKTPFPSNLTATEVFVATLETKSTTARLYASITAPGVECAQLSDVEQVSYACEEFAGTAYLTVAQSDLLPYTLSTELLNIDTVEAELHAATESVFPSGTQASPRWASSARDVYEIDLPNALDPSEELRVHFYGINQGFLNAWVTVGSIGDVQCAVAAAGNFTDTAELTVSSCFLAMNTKVFLVVELLIPSPECGVDVTYGFVPGVFNKQWQQGPNLNDGQPQSGAITVAGETIAYSYKTNANATAPVIEFFLEHYAAHDAATVVGEIHLVNKNLGVTCTRALPANTVVFLTSCDYGDTDEFVVVVTSAGTVLPEASYSVTVTEKDVNSLVSLEQVNVAGGGSDGAQQYTLLDVSETDAFESDESLVIIVSVEEGYSVKVNLYDWPCNSLPIGNEFSCFGGDCIVPWSWRSEKHVSNLGIVTSSESIDARYNITFVVGDENCVDQKDVGDLDFCSGVGYDWWKYGNPQHLDDSARLMFENIYKTFCPDCDCRQLTKDCNDTLTRYACEYMVRPCDSDGFETSVCRSTCTDVEDACGISFTAAGWGQLDCQHNWYADGNENGCKSNSFSGASSSSAGGLGGLSTTWWIVIGVAAAILLIIILLVAGMLIYYAVTKRPRDYERIGGIEPEESEPFAPSEAVIDNDQ